MADKLCPTCGSTLDLNTDNGTFYCPACDFRRPETLDEASERIRARGQRPAVATTHRGEVDLRARILFENGHDALWRGDHAAAIQAFERAIEVQPDFSDAHLWIAKTSDDKQVQRSHLGDILAHDPGHQEALRLLMVLNGQLTPEQAERSRSANEPVIQLADGAVKATATTLRCPVCGGDLTVDETNTRVVCRFCGHTAPLEHNHHASDGAEVLGTALLKRRAQPVKWIVGERILHCTQCGVERTIPAERLSTTCPFCGSTQVMQQDALNTIEKPDGLLPFRIDEDQAKAAVRERLRGVDQRLASIFDDNRVARAHLEGIYLPYWVFDALAEVSKTTMDKRTPSAYSRQNWMTNTRPYENFTLRDGLNGISIPAIKLALADGLGEFDLSAAVAYEPGLLAKYPAALYSIDFDAASLVARGKVSDHMRRRHGQSVNRDVEVQVFTNVLQMSFMLVLMPVWMATLYERDGDVRAALVNGQSGQVVLGRTEKAT